MPRRLLPRRILAAIAFLAAPLATAGRCAADTPAVVASIAPLHSLVAGVMAGVGAPALLIRPGASPHAYAFKPSEARALRHAKVVFWIGEGLETFLARPLRSLSGEAVVVEMTRDPAEKGVYPSGVMEDRNMAGDGFFLKHAE